MADPMLQHCKVVVNLCVWTIEVERMLFSEVRILGNAAFTRKLNDCDAQVSRPPYLKKAHWELFGLLVNFSVYPYAVWYILQNKWCIWSINQHAFFINEMY